MHSKTFLQVGLFALPIVMWTGYIPAVNVEVQDVLADCTKPITPESESEDGDHPESIPAQGGNLDFASWAPDGQLRVLRQPTKVRSGGSQDDDLTKASPKPHFIPNRLGRAIQQSRCESVKLHITARPIVPQAPPCPSFSSRSLF